MDLVTEKDIAGIVKKHLGFTLLLAVAPLIFVGLVGFYDKTAYSMIPFLSPISTVAAVSFFIKNIVIDLYASNRT